jgi:hypothetical protein
MKDFTSINVRPATRDMIKAFALTVGNPRIHSLIIRAITFCALPENRDAFVKHLTAPETV